MFKNINWFEFVPATMSAIAAIAAAYSAIISMRVSEQSNLLAKMTSIANHHEAAVSLYFKVINELCRETECLRDICHHLQNDWPFQIELKDNKLLGGTNPRPLRHVIGNTSDLLANYSLKRNKFRKGTSGTVLSIIMRNSFEKMSDAEYQKLLKVADGKYEKFETTFGIPSICNEVSSAPAFRFGYYQLLKRVNSEDWSDIWRNAWCNDGSMDTYKCEYLRIKPLFKKAHTELTREIAKLAHTKFPLSINAELDIKYKELLNTIDHLIEDAEPSNMDDYKDWPNRDEVCMLTICSLAIVSNTSNQLSSIYTAVNTLT
ncbi:hypothetical protein [Vibrio hepatarius]|uniref:hypothetical protein n=1 Tax=Vibrio hepatarius TaxID=171383 RepID=UPI001C084991|nr:hypothetical protein [Vibrio hepatarius]MBU2898034.1 hypothetical protein [Vibrio hepatarius]